MIKKFFTKNRIISLIFYFISGIVIAALCLIFRNPFTATSTQEALKCWSDILLVASVLQYGMVGLSYVSHQGVFDGLSYSFKYIVAKFIPMPHIDEEISGTYGDYKEIRKSKRKPIPVEGLISATVYLLAAIACFIAYYQV